MSEGFPSEDLDEVETKDLDEVENVERILTKEEIEMALGFYVENYSKQRILSDEKGIYLFEVQKPGETPGEITEYTYQRKGKFGQNESASTIIRIAYYKDDVPIGGKIIANYDEKTGEWK